MDEEGVFAQRGGYVVGGALVWEFRLQDRLIFIMAYIANIW